MTAFETFVNTELPRRSALLTYEITSYDGDPNSGSAPAILQGAPKGTWFLQQTGDIYWRKYTSSEWRVADSASFSTVTDINFYVRALDGDDSNDGTSGNPLETITEAISRIPLYVNHKVVINVGAHSGSGYEIPFVDISKLNANIWIYGNGGGSGDGFTEIVASTSALAGSTADLIKSSGLSTSEYGGFGEHFGRTVEILTGAAAGDLRTINNNTATDIVPNMPFSAAIGTGDTYRILEPSTVIYATSPTDPLVRCGNSSVDSNYSKNVENKVNFVNFKFNSASTINLDILNANVGFFGVELMKATTIRCKNTYIVSGIERVDYPEISVPSAVSDLGVGSITEWIGWGLSNRATGGDNLITINNCDYFGTINTGQVSYNYKSNCILYAGSCWGSYAFTLGFTSNAELLMLAGVLLLGSTSGNTGILLNHQSTLSMASIIANGIVIKGDKGIRSRNMSKATIDNYVPNGVVIEASSLGMGVEINSVIWIPASVMPTMVCSDNDFSEDYDETVSPISVLVLPSTAYSNISHGIIIRKY